MRGLSIKKNILLVGWPPNVVDYDKWPGLTPVKLLAGLERDRLISLGYEAKLGLIGSADTAGCAVTELLSENAYDCVLVGAGVRTVDDYIFLSEELINHIHRCAPTAKVCFNTGPFDSVDAVQGWV